MNKNIFLPLAAIAMAISPAFPALSAPLKTMPHGVYECAYPGNAAGSAWVPDESARFTLRNASSYGSERGSGTYLLKGKQLIFTRGPKKGERYYRSGDNQLTQIQKNGSHSRLRCFKVANLR